ncbi:hypothetical protein [Pontibacter liquoris]|uniref:hypothetical protein n=1 Tax=Pontibacter liquoris TaxID=2905677 RepID=UPI001FA6EA03|nr:hypothetical protein [Pontibacter liquoris]
MTIDEAIDKLNDISIYFIWDPKGEEPYFEKYKTKEKVKFNHYQGIYTNERKDYGFDEVIEAATEIENVKILGKGRLRTKSYAFQIVNPVNKNAIAYKYKPPKDKIQTTLNEIKVSIESSSLIHSVAIIDKQLTSRMSPMSEYPQVVQINFGDKNPIDEECNHIINSFLFELENTYDLKFEFLDYNHPHPGPSFNINDFPREKEFNQLEVIARKISENQLPDYNTQAIELYLNSKHTDNEEIRLMLLYKVFEYFGPIVIKLETQEELAKKLSNPKVNDPDSEYLTSIIELVTKYNKRSNDLGMLKEVFKKCIDLEIIKGELPSYLSKTLRKKTDFTELKTRVAQSLYSTRNSIVHAKSNYESEGNECKAEELSQFNKFLSLAASQLIKWHKCLPKHQR